MKLYMVFKNDEEILIKEFEQSTNLLLIKNWIEDWLNKSEIQYDSIVMYLDEQNYDDVVILYGGEAYFLLKK